MSGKTFGSECHSITGYLLQLAFQSASAYIDFSGMETRNIAVNFFTLKPVDIRPNVPADYSQMYSRFEFRQSHCADSPRYALG
jgi:hypothetical protein